MKLIVFLAVSGVFILLTTLIFTKSQIFPKKSDFANPVANLSTFPPTPTSTPTPTPIKKQLPTFEKGLNIVFFESKGETNFRTVADDVFTKVKKLGITHVSLVFFFFQNDSDSVEIYEDTRRTLKDFEIRQIIKLAKSKNLIVQLRPFLGVKASFSDPETDVGRWNINPTSPDSWFENYSAILTKYARISQEEGVATFGIGSEMTSQAHNSDKWRELIRNIRGVFRGKIIYAGNWDEFVRDGPFVKDLSWLADVDLIGVDAYFPLQVGANPNVSELSNAWSSWTSVFERLAQSGRRVIISETGITAASEHFDKPWITSTEVSNLAAQEKYYQAAIEFFRGKVSGLYFWAVDGYKTGDAGGFSPLGRPAEKVLTDWRAN